MRGLFLVGMMLAAGCTSMDPSQSVPTSTPRSSTDPPIVATYDDPLSHCVSVRAAADRASFAWGETVGLRLKITNCGGESRGVYADPRCDPAETLTLGSGARWLFAMGNDTPRVGSRGPDATCTPIASIAPGQSHTAEWHWNGTIAYAGACGDPSCDVLAPAPGGIQPLYAVGSALQQSFVNVTFDARAPCAKLDVIAEPSGTLVVAVVDCGVAPMAVMPSHDCWGERALFLTVTRGNRTWVLDRARDGLPHEDRTMPHSMGYCISGYGNARAAVPPAGRLQDAFAWNGTLIEDDMCPAPGGGMSSCTHVERASPGTYGVHAAFAPADGATAVEADATFDWPG